MEMTWKGTDHSRVFRKTDVVGLQEQNWVEGLQHHQQVQ
jgi:hypothetical protein